MEQRLNIKELASTAYESLYMMESFLAQSKISRKLRELIKIRASQINGCAYCIQMHTRDARKLGEAEDRIYSLSAWRESPLYTEKERSVLQMTDEISLISDSGLSDSCFNKLKENFGDEEIAHLILAVCQINFWNRIAVSTHMIFKD